MEWDSILFQITSKNNQMWYIGFYDTICMENNILALVCIMWVDISTNINHY